jgi:hypothetical protein
LQAALRTKHRSKGRAMPGWGNVANPEDWKVVDDAAQDYSGTQGAFHSLVSLKSKFPSSTNTWFVLSSLLAWCLSTRL